jgi:uncharacterized protein (TIGR03435 family)
LRNQALPAIVQVTAAAAMLGGSVVDRTGLTGTFDIDLDYVPGWVLLGDAPPPDGVPLVTAFEEQLGLTFERIEEPMDVLVIDHVERPDPN